VQAEKANEEHEPWNQNSEQKCITQAMIKISDPPNVEARHTGGIMEKEKYIKTEGRERSKNVISKDPS